MCSYLSQALETGHCSEKNAGNAQRPIQLENIVLGVCVCMGVCACVCACVCGFVHATNSHSLLSASEDICGGAFALRSQLDPTSLRVHISIRDRCLCSINQSTF